MEKTPFEQIRKKLAFTLSPQALEYLPKKWEKIGEVAVIRFPSHLKAHRKLIGKVYAEVLNCKTVLNDVGGISGRFRTPKVKLLYGSPKTETIHIEHGIRYKLDPQKVMFSSGNMEERIRMATVSNTEEVVVDLFAGIGYFSLPVAVYSKPKKVYACEINPIAYDYLCQNIVLNQVTMRVKPLLGDNRDIAPKNIAHRVIMGYLDETHTYLPAALDCLHNHTGIIHYHDVSPSELVLQQPMKKIQKIVDSYERSITVLSYRKVKSYAPGVSHGVFDLMIGEI
jgi:tRNA wybutosine-synthesizing protein 2